MRSVIGWFKNSAKIKRWIILLLIAMVLICYGISKILILESLNVINLAEIVASFVAGFVVFIISIIRIQKRALELVIEANTAEKSENKKEIDIKTLVSKKNIYEKGPKIVVIGGGDRIK